MERNYQSGLAWPVERGIHKYQRVLLKVNINNTIIAGIKM
jgi:hypothetical protein